MTRPTILDLDMAVTPRKIVPLPYDLQDDFCDDPSCEHGCAEMRQERDEFNRKHNGPDPAWDDVRKYVEGLERSNKMWRQNSIDTHTALAAMRNDINQFVPLPSLESDLLQGPDNSVFCATVASSVAARIAELETRLADADRVIERVPPYLSDMYKLICRGSEKAAAGFIEKDDLVRAARAYKEGK